MKIHEDEIEFFELDDSGEVIQIDEDSEKEEEEKEKISNSEDDEFDLEDLSKEKTSADDDSEDEDTDTNEDEEEKDDKDKDTSEAHSGGDSSNNSSSTLILQQLATAMRDEGYLPNSSEDEIRNIKKPSDLASFIQKEIEVNEYNDLPEDAKEALVALRNGADWGEIVNVKKQEFQNSNITEEQLKGDDNANVELRKNVLTQLYKRTTQFNDDKINKLVKKSIDTGTDEVDAIEALNELKELDKKIISEFNKNQEKLNAERKKAQEENLKNLKKVITEKEDIIPGIQLNKTQRNSIYKSIVEPVAKGANGVPVNDFSNKYNTDENFRLKVHAIAVLTNGFEDLSTLKAKAKKSALQELDNQFNKKNDITSSGDYNLESDAELLKEQQGLKDFLNSKYK